MKLKHVYLLFAFLCLLLIDQISKHIVRERIMPGEQLSLIGDLFKLTHIENRGVAFSLMSENYVFLLIIPNLLLLGLIIFLFIKKNLTHHLQISILFIVAGGTGNLIDRLAMGSVTDMFSLSFFPPVFNFADICVVLGAVFASIFILIDKAVIKKKN